MLKRLESAVAVAENRRTLRAVAVLEAYGGADARRLLMVLSKGALEATLTQAAAAALTRRERRAVP